MTFPSSKQIGNGDREKVSALINDPSDFHKASAVTVLGKAASVVEGDKEEVLKIYLQKYPYLEQFARSSSSAVMTIQVTGLTMSLRFQNPHLLADGNAV